MCHFPCLTVPDILNAMVQTKIENGKFIYLWSIILVDNWGNAIIDDTWNWTTVLIWAN